MEFLCEDLREHGVVLIPPSSPEYEALLAGIRSRADHLVAGSPPLPEQLRPRIPDDPQPTSAILVNRSARTIAAIQWVRLFEEADGRTYFHAIGPGINPGVLLPHGIPPKHRKVASYWNTILPGSKRYVGPDSQMIGDNTDVRLPADDERWTGGGMGSGGSRAGNSSGREIRRITLKLDGVFFSDGAFAGPNERQFWEQITSYAEAHTQLLDLVRKGRENGDPAEQIIAGIKTLTGPWRERLPSPRSPGAPLRAPGLDPIQRLAWQFSHIPEDRVIDHILSWADAPVPQFHKL